MSHVTPSRPSTAKDPSQSLRHKMQRPDPDLYDAKRVQALRLAEFRHNAEEFGRAIGIILHWCLIKPAQLIAGFMGLCAFFFMRPLMTLTLICVGLITYLLGWVAYLSYLTFWT